MAIPEDIQQLRISLEQAISQREILSEELQKANLQLENKIHGLSGVRRIVDALKHIRDVPKVLEVILDTVLEETTAENCSLMTLDKEKKELVFRAAKGQMDTVANCNPDMGRSPFRLDGSIAGRAVQSCKAIYIADTSTESQFQSTSDMKVKIGSFLCVPLIIDGEAIGVINFSHPRVHVFDDSDQPLLQLIADQVALVLNNIQIMDETQQLNHLLLDERHRLEGLVENLPNGVCLLDANWQVSVANSIARDYFMVLVGTREPETLRWLSDRAIEDLMTPRQDGLPHEVATGSPPQIFEIEVSPIYSGTTEGGLVLMIRDVTQEREVQGRMEQQDRLAAVGQLAAGIAHDFNNLLTTVIGYAQLLEIAEDLSDLAKERIRTIGTQGHRAVQLIQQILDFSRKSNVQRKPLGLTSFLKETIKLLERILPESIEIITEFDQGDFMVEANVTQLQQVFTNLVVNARDAMDGTGELRIVLTSLELGPEDTSSLPDMAPGSWVIWKISDNGTGMPKQVAERIFEPFFTTKERGKGTGLGLAQVYGIVKQHSGEVRVESDEGVGTTFTVLLPQIVGTDIDTQADAFVITSGKQETVLVVEDEEEVLELTKSLLEHLNYKVIAVSEGQKALEACKKYLDEIDLVLSDIVMPGLGGIDLARLLKAAGLDIPVVLMTGYVVDQDEGEKIPENVFAVLNKPLDLDTVGRTLRDALKS